MLVVEELVTFVKIPESLTKKADLILGFFSIYAEEPNQDFYTSQNVPFIVEPILDNTAIYCVQQVGDSKAGAVIVGEDGSFLLTGHTRKGKQYLLDKWLSGERTSEDFLSL